MTAFIVLHFLICLFLVFVILLQPGKGDGAGIGFGSSSSQSIFGSRGAGNFLTKMTSIMALLFLATSFFLTRSRMQESGGSVTDRVKVPVTAETPATPPSTTPDPAAKPVEGAKK